MSTRKSIIGGESSHRGFLSGNQSGTRTVALLMAVAVGCLLMLFFYITGLLVGLVIVAATFFLTHENADGEPPWTRYADRVRMRGRRATGVDDFIPRSAMSTEEKEVDLAALPRKERRQAARELAAFRDTPDGVEGMEWMRKEPGKTAVLLHAPTSEDPYLSVAFSVDGPLQGLHGDQFISQAQRKFGELLAGWGARSKVVSGVQTITRVLPADSSEHEAWMSERIDPKVPGVLIDSYQELLDDLGASSFNQRHYAVIRFDINSTFTFNASRRGEGRDGWLVFVDEQVDSIVRRLQEAMFHDPKPLTARQLAAVLRHLQHPDWPLDRVRDADPDDCWFPSHDEWSWTEVVGRYPDPYEPEVLHDATSWYHRTAYLPPSAVTMGEVDGLWLSPLLIQMSDQVVRTLSLHIRLIPARDARMLARSDRTADAAEIARQERKGMILDDETETALSASTRRHLDLSSGAGHHGASWGGFLTISARSPEDLQDASIKIEEAAHDAGIDRLKWEDTMQAAASACTWPVSRGLAAPKISTVSKVFTNLDPKGSKEALT